jgi:hypothetical protein
LLTCLPACLPACLLLQESLEAAVAEGLKSFSIIQENQWNAGEM